MAALLPLLSVVGCADKHIGRPCMTGLAEDDKTRAVVNGQSLECPSRICLLPTRSVTTSTAGAMCTDFCSGDDDCADGEKYDKNSNPNGCHTGFACRIALGKLPVLMTPITCKRVCVCKDFLPSNEPDMGDPTCS